MSLKALSEKVNAPSLKRPSLKVLLVSRFFYPHLGGVEKHMNETLTHLNASRSYQFTVLTEVDSNRKRSKKAQVKIEELRLPRIKFIGLILVWVQVIYKWKLFVYSDLIHIHDVFIWILPLRLVLFWKKFYITYHGWEGKYPISNNSLLQKKLASHLTSGSIGVGKYLKAIYNINITFIVYGASKFKPKSAHSLNFSKILFIGRLESDTGLEVVLNAFKKAHIKQQISFIGDGPLRAQCERIGKVEGFKNITKKTFDKGDICLCSGYLSVIDSLAVGNVTVVIVNGYVRKLAFQSAPFYKAIHIINNEEDFIAFFKHLKNNKKLIKKKISYGLQWSEKNRWVHIAKTYSRLWNS